MQQPRSTASNNTPSLSGIATASAIVLAVEVLLTRILCYTVTMDFVHLVLAISMAGFGIAGTWVTLKGVPTSPDICRATLTRWSCFFGLSILVGLALFARFSPEIRHTFWLASALSVLLLIPFICGGMVITLVLSMADGRSIGKIYAADLLGAAAGCLIPTLVLRTLGAEALLSILATATVIPAVLFAGSRWRHHTVILCSTLVIGVLCIQANKSVFPFRGEQNSQASNIRLGAKTDGYLMEPVYTRWNTVGRIDIYDFHGVPDAPEPYPFGFYAQDDTMGALVVTWDGKTKSASPPKNISHPVPALCSDSFWGQAYFQPRKEVLIIGVGGGLDIQCALFNEASHIDAVEINPDSLNALKGLNLERTGRVAAAPNVSLHLRDGRSFAHQAESKKYDLIQMSGVDTKQMLASGARAVGENNLYTQEAFDNYLRALNDDGVISLLYAMEPLVMRLVNTAVMSLQKIGVKNPHEHILIHQSGIVYGIIIKKSAFTPEDIAAYRKTVLNSQEPFPFRVRIFESIMLPVDLRFAPVLDPEGGHTPHMQAFYDAIKTGNLENFIRQEPVHDIKPVTDDRPFIFDLWRYNQLSAIQLPHVRILLGAMLCIVLACLIFCVLPVWHLRKSLSRSTIGTTLLYFSCVGFGFLAIEVWLIHRLAMWLGHQSTAFAVVLASLLTATGIGSATGVEITPAIRRRILAAIPVLLMVMLGFHMGLGNLIELTWDLSLASKIILAIVIAMIPGLLMGIPFPAGLAWLRQQSADAVPLGVSLNFFASVLASLLIIPITLLLGYTTLLYIALAAYATIALMAWNFDTD